MGQFYLRRMLHALRCRRMIVVFIDVDTYSDTTVHAPCMHKTTLGSFHTAE